MPDLAPALPQPHYDAAPMISGRGTHIIADARGAYIARNLDGLIDHMDEAQRQRFFLRVAQQGLIAARENVRFHEPHPTAQRLLDAAHEALDAAERCIDCPQRAADAMMEVLHEAGVVRANRHIDPFTAMFIFLVMSLLAETPSDAAYWLRRCAIQGQYQRGKKYAAGVERTVLSRQIGESIDCWLLEAAWAILQGRHPETISLHP